MRARYYNPVLSRFISQDPISLGGDQTNFFAYTDNNPTNFVDPTGRNGGGADDAWAAVASFNGWQWVHSGPGVGDAGGSGNDSATGGGGSGGDSSEGDTANQIAAYEAAQSGASSPLGVAEAEAGIGAGEMAAVSGLAIGAAGGNIQVAGYSFERSLAINGTSDIAGAAAGYSVSVAGYGVLASTGAGAVVSLVVGMTLDYLVNHPPAFGVMFVPPSAPPAAMEFAPAQMQMY